MNRFNPLCPQALQQDVVTTLKQDFGLDIEDDNLTSKLITLRGETELRLATLELIQAALGIRYEEIDGETTSTLGRFTDALCGNDQWVDEAFNVLVESPGAVLKDARLLQVEATV